MGRISRAGSGDRSGGGNAGPELCSLATRYPALVEFLTLAVWDDGGKRQLGSALVAWNDGRWRIWLHDRDASRSAWLSGETLTDVLGAADAGLEADSLEWRRDSQKGGRR